MRLGCKLWLSEIPNLDGEGRLCRVIATKSCPAPIKIKKTYNVTLTLFTQPPSFPRYRCTLMLHIVHTVWLTCGNACDSLIPKYIYKWVSSKVSGSRCNMSYKRMAKGKKNRTGRGKQIRNGWQLGFLLLSKSFSLCLWMYIDPWYSCFSGKHTTKLKSL